MTKSAVITVTSEWQNVASGAAVITIQTESTGAILFNETESDANAYSIHPEAGEQFQQTDSVDTYVRSDDSGWKIVVDGVL